MTKDMTQGSPAKLMLAFAVPLLIGNIFQQVYNFSDAAIAGKFIGNDALAAIGATGAVMFMVFGFYFGLTSGLAVVTGQRFGAKDPEGVRKSFAASIIISSVLTLGTTVLCTVLTPKILVWMNTPESIMEPSYQYLFIMFLGTGTIVFYGLISSVIRALGDSITPLVFLIISCLLNVGLDLLFILKFSWGVSGVAWATVIAQSLSGFLCLGCVIWKFPILRLRWCNWNVCAAFYWEHLRISLPMAFQFSITAVGVVILQAMLNDLGTACITAATVAGKIDQVSVQPMFSFGIAMAAFAAQNYGARNLERIRKGVAACLLLSLAFVIATAIVPLIFPEQLASLFMKEYDAEVIRNTKYYIYVNTGFYPVLVALLVFRNVLQGIGHTFYPLMAGVAELIIRTIAALFLVKFWGFAGVCYAHPFAWIGATVILIADYVFVMRKLKREGIPDNNILVRRTEGIQAKG